MINKTKKWLLDLGIIEENSIEVIHDRVRDRADVSVLQCKRSEVIFLSRSDHMEYSHYQDQDGFEYWGVGDRAEAVKKTSVDSDRRAFQFKKEILNKRWLDFGAGAGGVLDKLAPCAKVAFGVEAQDSCRKVLSEAGYQVFASIDDVPVDDLEVISLFHVLEHLIDPKSVLEKMASKLSVGGKVIIEVPHAKDFLLSFFNCPEFKEFTFWSEHLVLHTRESLRILLEASGFKNIKINGCQRFPIANHLHWFSRGKPGGQEHWEVLRDEALEASYENLLLKKDCTDTLIAVAEK